ncbi:MAG: trigger factor [Candidatus Eisenbacteria bacterium]|nr:trigger factor [Candidatus Eisenbacteria bacterium]
MSHTITSTGSWQHTVTIEVPSDEVQSRLDDVARTLQRRVVMPGFRKGKVPLDRVRVEFAAHIEQEFLDHFLPQVTGRTLDEAKLVPVVPPTITNLKFSPGQPLVFDALVDVAPQVEVKDWKGIPVTRRARQLDDAAIDAVVANLRDDAAVFTDVQRPAADGDVILLDSQRLDAKGNRMASTKSKGLRIQLGSPDLLPDLAAALAGAEEGQERTITVNYPAEYGQAELAGKVVRYVVKIRKIQEKKLRDLDDTFARELFRLESLGALRDRVRQNLESEDGTRVRRELEGAITEELIRRNPFELPARLVTYMLGQVVREQTEGREVGAELQKQLEEHYQPGVERSLRREVLLMGVAKQESIEVSDEEISAEIDRMCAQDPRQASRVRARYQSADRRRALGEGILERKAMDLLIGAAQVKDEPIAEAVAGAAR